jgi:hypothetical protein
MHPEISQFSVWSDSWIMQANNYVISMAVLLFMVKKMSRGHTTEAMSVVVAWYRMLM